MQDLSRMEGEASTVGDRWKSWAQLVRLPNTLTTVSDILAGAALATSSMQPIVGLVMLVLASICLYWSGMVLNDVNDVEVDRQQRRNRPLPRGDISIGTARRFGWLLIATSLAATFCASTFSSESSSAAWGPMVIAAILALAIVVYDSGWKTKPFAPWVMGLCRGLNIVLGASLGLLNGMDFSQWVSMPHLWMTAVGHCIYVAGLTIAARREALTSSRFFLSAGWSLSAVGCALLANAPRFAPDSMFLHVSPHDWYPILILLLILPLAKRAYYSIRDPGARNVQLAIKQAIMTIILLDAAATLQYAGPYWGSMCCLLILPSLWLGSFFRST